MENVSSSIASAKEKVEEIVAVVLGVRDTAMEIGTVKTRVRWSRHGIISADWLTSMGMKN